MTPHTTPRISVVIPCYNGERFLAETLGSIDAQTYPVAEVIVIDDGSTDGSAEFVRRWGGKTRLIQQPNQGESVARNRGIAEATGDWIALLDADDLWTPTKLERQIEVIQRSSEPPCCVFTDFYYFCGSERLRDVARPEVHQLPEYRAQLLCNSEAAIHPSSTLIRIDAARAVPFPVETRYAEDMIFFSQLRDHGPFIRIPEPLTGYRVSNANQSRSPGFGLRSVRSRYGWFQSHLERFSPGEQVLVKTLLTEQLVVAHDVAFWNRLNDVVRDSRSFYREMHGASAPLPPSFEWRLYPRWLGKLKDWLDRGRSSPTK